SGGFASSPSAVRTDAEPAFAPVAALSVATEVPGSSSTHAPHHSHAPARQTASSSSGVVVGLFAMGLTALSFYWLTERSDKIGATVETRMKELEKTQADAATRAVGRATDLENRLLALERGFHDSVEAERKGVENRFLDAQSKQEKALAPLSGLQADVAGLKDIVPSTQRHDQELLASAQKVAELENRAGTLEAALAEMKKQVESRPAPSAAPAAPSTPVGTPAWMGLVAQLESQDNGARWVAVSSLGETKDPAVAEYLLPRLKDVDIFVRMATARVLGDLGSTKAIGALIEALNDQDSSVREAAYVSLCTVSKKSLPFDAHQDAGERSKRVKAWQEWWKKASEDGAAQ
ncbi:MAG TPA: HEAT repeat domain-containing protein, partial [Planctomycetota bacterium]|nr:HEAT repeat domain-containing protein [Planctomycetota bacterium]